MQRESGGESTETKRNRGTSPRICTELPQSPATQPTVPDIEEFGRRIGIDVRRDPHLIHLAVEGLQKPLPPNWKPCFDPIRNVYYYLDTKNQRTQWEHPLDSVYKLKVIQAKEASMDGGSQSSNQLQKPSSLRDFPLSRRKDILSPLVLLPPPKSLPADNVKEKADPTPGILDLNIDLRGRANRLAPLKGLKPIGGQEPLQGSNPPRPPQVPLKLEEGKRINPPSWIPNEEIVRDDSENEETSSVSAIGHRIPKPNIQLVSKPNDLQRTLFIQPRLEPIRAKGNVQFNLDQNVELKFETSSQGSSNQNDEDETEEDEEDENSSENQSGDGVPDQQPQPPIRLTPVSTMPTKPIVNEPVTVTVVQEILGAGDKGRKEEEEERMKIDAEIRQLRAKLEEERKEALGALQKEHKERLEKEKASFDLLLEKELAKVREEQTNLMTTQLQSIILETQEALQVRKKEILETNQEILKGIEQELGTVDKVTVLETKKRELFEEIENEAVKGVEELRRILLAEHKREIDQLRAIHEEFLQNIREEFRREEEKVRAEQKEKVEELRQIPKEKSPEKEVEKEATNQKPPPRPDSPIGSPPLALEKERELLQTKRKYRSLQEKYSALKEELRTVTQKPWAANGSGEAETLSVVEDSANDTLDMDVPIRNDRLGRALGALEILRDQIMDMNRTRGDEGSCHTSPRVQQTRKERLRPRAEPEKKSVRKASDVASPSRADEGFDEFQVVREAKAFIQSQRQRLKMDQLENSREGGRHQSEATESSGIGSLQKSRRILRETPPPKSPSSHKSRVAKDIDTILLSLKKLDREMESLWTLVGQDGDTRRDPSVGGFLTPLIHPTSPAALAHFSIMREKGGLDNVTNSPAWYPLLTNTELRTRYRLTAGGDSVGPNSPPITVVPNSSFLQNLEFNQPSRHVFEDEMQNFEALQERIWKTYGPGESTEDGALSSSIQAKTKDLRDWLHKF